MPKKTATEKPPSSDNLPVAYHVGFASHYYLRMAASYWRTASLEDPSPVYLDLLFADFKNALHFLSSTMLADAQSTDRVATAAEKFRFRFENAWGCQLHRHVIRRRDQTDPESFNPAEMLVGSPLESAECRNLVAALADFIDALPEPARGWTCLGSKVAEVLDPVEAGEPGSRAIPSFLSQIAPLRRHRLLREFPRVAPCSKERILQLHDRLVTASNATRWAASPKNAPLIGRGIDLRTHLGVSQGAAGIAYLSDDPAMSMTELAKKLGLNRTSLYRLPLLKTARKEIEANRLELQSGLITGTKNGHRTVDGIYEHDPTDPHPGQG